MLMFREHLARQVMDGTKTQTRRKRSDNAKSPWYREKCAHEVGSRHAVCPGRGVHGIGFVVIDDVSLVRLGHITHDDAVAEGFADVRDFMHAWEQINDAWNPREWVWLLRFHVETADEVAAP